MDITTISNRGKIFVSQKDILIWIETHLVQPFEGILQSENKEAVEIHEKITNYNRDKFNQLKNMLEETEKDGKKINRNCS